MTAAPPGWYPDPELPDQLRYWSGTAWTDARSPAGSRAPMPYGAGTHLRPPAPTAAGATASLVLGILSLACFGALTGVPAMIVGRMATREIDRSEGRLGGRGLATAGFVTGLVGTLLSVVLLAFVLLFIAVGGDVEGPYDDTCSTIDPNPVDHPECF